jgi:hypothetical protein
MVGAVLWAVDGWDILPSGPFEKAKGGERLRGQTETAAMGSRVGRGASAIHLIEEISFAD